MQNQKLEELANQLRKTDEYRVISKYQKPEYYNVDNTDSKKLIGVFLDIEATGLFHEKDKLIELGMVKFEYNEDGYIFNLLEEFNGYHDPKMPIPPHIIKLTGITDEMVKGHFIEEKIISKYLEGTDIIIAHNARFDRAFFESTFPNIESKAWACSISDIDWKDEDISSFKLEYIAYRYDFFYEGHRAIIDCLAGIHVLAQNLINSKQPVLKRLLDNALELEFKIWAKNAPYNCKDLLKSRGYRWGVHPTGHFKAWYITLSENKVEAEMKYLNSDIYDNIINIPIEIFDSFSKYSINNQLLSNQNKYQDKISWARELCDVD